MLVVPQPGIATRHRNPASQPGIATRHRNPASRTGRVNLRRLVRNAYRTWQPCHVDFVDADYPRRLVLLRHAKSDWPEGVTDHDRPLATRGRRDAPLVGRWLARSGYLADAVVCSTAHRARQTWELAAAGLPAPPAARLDPRVYEATVLGLLMLVRELPDGIATVAIVGHNPGLAELAVGLAAPPPQPPVSFPTAAVAVLGLSGPWSLAGPGEARLLAFAVPADMR